MTIDVLAVKDANSVTRNVVVDNDGAANLTQVNKVAYGPDDAAPTLVNWGSPLPQMEDRFTALLQSSSGISASASSQTLIASSANRMRVFVSNGGASGVWLNFGTTVTVGNGVYLPAHSKDTYYTNMSVTVILETGGSAGPVSAVGV